MDSHHNTIPQNHSHAAATAVHNNQSPLKVVDLSDITPYEQALIIEITPRTNVDDGQTVEKQATGTERVLSNSGRSETQKDMRAEACQLVTPYGESTAEFYGFQTSTNDAKDLAQNTDHPTEDCVHPGTKPRMNNAKAHVQNMDSSTKDRVHPGTKYPP